ncbi:MAG: TRAP transporter small permease [Spirochaetales bacterium]|nr:TRAP transporter small permease [Spirochaetales bacterium]
MFFSWVARCIKVLAVFAGLAILLMMSVTVIDVILRLFNRGITGAYDLVRACGVVGVACALPYLTAVKGHIAIEFLYHRCGRLGRVLMDSLFRFISLGLFGILAVRVFQHGISLLKSGEVFPNLGLPLFWIPMLISVNCALMLVVIFYHLLHPGKEFIKP